MCQYSADDGCANDWHLMHLGMLANSGAALVVVEATHVERHGRITHGCLGLYSDDNEAALARVIAQCRRAGTRQIRHPDRPCRPQGLGAAALGGRRPRSSRRGRPVGDHRRLAHSLRRRAGTRRARRPKPTSTACATPSSSPPSARCASASTPSSCTWRTAICCTASCRRCPTSAPTSTAARSENRMRFPLSVARAVRAVVPKGMPLGARITGSDWREGGLTPDDAVAIAKMLKAEGLDFICVSSGGVAADIRNPTEPGYNVADRRAREEGGRHRHPHRRPDPRRRSRPRTSWPRARPTWSRSAARLLDDPHWGWHAAKALGADVPRPPQYARAGPKLWAPAAKQRQAPGRRDRAARPGGR